MRLSPTGRARGARTAALLATLVATLVAARPERAAAQAQPAALRSAASAACVGGAIGCEQIDLTLALRGGRSASVDAFTFTFDTPGWTLTPFQPGEAEDALGPTFFTPNVDAAGRVLGGTFAPGFEAQLESSLRVRAQFVGGPGAHADASDLHFTYGATAGGRQVLLGRDAAFASRMDAACVGGVIGCDQVDFMLTLPGAAAATVNYFALHLLGTGVMFSDAQAGEAEDALGFTAFTSRIEQGGTLLLGSFAPGFEATVDRTLRLRAQFAPGTGFGPGGPLFTYALGRDGVGTYVGIGAAGTVVPEPTTAVLLAAAGVVVGAVGAARRRRRGAD